MPKLDEALVDVGRQTLHRARRPHGRSGRGTAEHDCRRCLRHTGLRQARRRGPVVNIGRQWSPLRAKVREPPRVDLVDDLTERRPRVFADMDDPVLPAMVVLVFVVVVRMIRSGMELSYRTRFRTRRASIRW